MIKNCIVCGNVYDGDDNSKYCSMECKSIDLNREKNEEIIQSDLKLDSASNVEKFSIVYNDKHKGNNTKTYNRVCTICGKEFIGYKASKICSDECRKTRNKIKNKNKSEKLQDKSEFEPRNFHKTLPANNKSGYRGVYFGKAKKKWRSQIRFNNKCYKLGLHVNKSDAIKERQKAELEFYGKILETEKTEEIDYKYIEDYVLNMEDTKLIQLCNSIYDLVNNEFYILYKQFEEKVQNIDELQNMFLEESNKRFYKLNKINRMINNDLE